MTESGFNLQTTKTNSAFLRQKLIDFRRPLGLRNHKKFREPDSENGSNPEDTELWEWHSEPTYITDVSAIPASVPAPICVPTTTLTHGGWEHKLQVLPYLGHTCRFKVSHKR